MTRTLFLALAAISLTQAQAGEKAAFEVASIKPCKPDTPAPPMEHAGLAEFTSPGGRFSARATSIKFLMEWAYGIQPAQLSGAPHWLAADRYDILAKADHNATDDEMKRMIQVLLTDRFQLKAHHELREISAYVISLGKTAPKISRPKDDETHGLHFGPNASHDQRPSNAHIVATRYTVPQLIDAFARQLGTVIVDRTGLEGEFDFVFELTPDDTRQSLMDPGLLLQAMREQIGLTVKFEKTPVDFLVIDHIEKVAAEN